jgi:hypothetical protein
VLNVAYGLNFYKVKNIPVIINNFNRLAYPLQLIKSLEQKGYRNIVILDNNSNYPPLLKFYDECKYIVVRERINHGHLAFWKSGLYKNYQWNYFVYTDSDVVPVTECPEDFLQTFKSVLDNNYNLDKVGFGIRIDDLPDSFSLKEKVIAYEKKYWDKPVKPNMYDAPIDTTFALYKPLSGLKSGEVYTLSALRMGPPFLIHHLPWYVDSNNMSEEETYYLSTSNKSSSIGSGTVYFSDAGK